MSDAHYRRSAKAEARAHLARRVNRVDAALLAIHVHELNLKIHANRRQSALVELASVPLEQQRCLAHACGPASEKGRSVGGERARTHWVARRHARPSPKMIILSVGTGALSAPAAAMAS
jgi:hypothetical protein